jgi:hypothetical protein
MKKTITTAALLLASFTAIANDYTYKEIAKRNPDYQLSAAAMSKMKLQAECLVGIKKLNFRRKDSFDPIAEWTTFRTQSLMEQFTPCETLVMLEIAQKHLRADK